MHSEETYSNGYAGKHMSYAFHIQNGMKQGGNFYCNCFLIFIYKKKKNWKRMKLSGAHQFHVCAADNELGRNINTVK